MLSMISDNNWYDIDLSFEMGISEVLYGNTQIYKQIVSILLSVANWEAKADKPTTCDVRFVWVDSNRDYIIGINIGIPMSRTIDEGCVRIFMNKRLNSEFFVEFKEELQKYDLGIFLIGYLVSMCTGTINSFVKDDYIMVCLKMPFSLSDETEIYTIPKQSKLLIIMFSLFSECRFGGSKVLYKWKSRLFFI